MNIYTKHLKVNSRLRRQDQTPAEIILWARLRNRQFLNIKFRRQVPIEKYIVDFYCKELNLVIEIDGYSHDETKFEYDKLREEYLKGLGLNILRFTERDIIRRLEEVLLTIEVFLDNRPHPLVKY